MCRPKLSRQAAQAWRKSSPHLQGPLWTVGALETPAVLPTRPLVPPARTVQKEGQPGHQWTASIIFMDWS